jgi:transcriptional regulator with XRE-family HTH domain
MDKHAKAKRNLLRFGRKIAVERAYRNISLKKIAEQTGIPIFMLSEIEAGTTDFSIEDMFLLLNVLEVDLAEFFAGFEPQRFLQNILFVIPRIIIIQTLRHK